MTQAQLEKFVNYLQKENWLVFGPVWFADENPPEDISPYLKAHQTETPKEPGVVLIKQINHASELAFEKGLPFYSFKRFFVPECEKLFAYQNDTLKEINQPAKIALIGVDLLDLKAINLYDQVFEKDPY